MPAIVLRAFSGEQPRVIPRLMPDSAAQSAVNTRLDDGGLTPMRRPAQITTAEADWETIYLHGETWLGWEGHVHAVPGPVAQDRLYYTGDGAPKMRVDGDVYPLAVPRPVSGLTAALTGSGSGDVATRLYVFTWVTEFDEESEPSPVSNEVAWQPGHEVTLSGFPAVPTDRGIDRQRIYRSQTGSAGTYLYFVAERAAGTGDFNDDIAVDAFQEPLPSQHWQAPPDDLAGLIALPNGMMAAFSERDLRFCEPWRPHAWPERYVLTMDAPIVALGAIGASIVVMTTAQPYLVTGSAPDTMQATKLELNLPCINARGVVDLGFAIAYPSHEGLVVVRADGAFTLATANIFSREGWQALSPQTMIASQISQRWIAFYDTETATGQPLAGAILIDITGAASFLIRSDIVASATFYDIATGALYYIPVGSAAIYRFDPPNTARMYQYWKSRQFVLPYPENFGAIQIDTPAVLAGGDAASLDALIAAVLAANAALIAAGSIGGEIGASLFDALALGGDILDELPSTPSTILVSVYADGVKVHTLSSVNRPARLPSGFLARTWEVDVVSDVRVDAVVIAKTIDELRRTPA